MNVLLVEDDPDLRGLLAESLRRQGLVVVEAKDGRTALSALEQDEFDVVLCDRGLPDGEGEDIARRTRSSARFVYLSGDVPDASHDVVLQKPVTVEQIMRVLGPVEAKAETERELELQG